MNESPNKADPDFRGAYVVTFTLIKKLINSLFPLTAF